VGRGDFRRAVIFALGELDVLGDVDQHRAGTAGGGDLEGLMDDLRQVADVFDQVVVLGARAGHADRVGFLEGVGADQVRGDLAGDDDHRDRVHQGVHDAGDGVGRAGTRGDQDDARLARAARVAFGGVGRALLVADQDVLQARLVEQRVIDRQDRAARIAEQHLDALVHEAANHDLGAGHGARGVGGAGALALDGLMGGHGTDPGWGRAGSWTGGKRKRKKVPKDLCARDRATT
jgi:hypothetical protein